MRIQYALSKGKCARDYRNNMRLVRIIKFLKIQRYCNTIHYSYISCIICIYAVIISEMKSFAYNVIIPSRQVWKFVMQSHTLLCSDVYTINAFET